MKAIIKPVVVLTAICLVITFLLSFTNEKTAPVIEQVNIQIANEARAEVLPEADGFEKIEIDNLPEGAVDIYKATNDTGYVASTTAQGYGGTMKVTVGIDENGAITKVKVTEHSETPGLGSRAFEEKYTVTFKGANETTLPGVATISGATISSTALKRAIQTAFELYDMAKGAN